MQALTPGVTTGYFYASIGTLGEDTSPTVSGVNFTRIFNNTQRASLTVEIFAVPSTSTFVFQETGHDVASTGAPAISFVATSVAASGPEETSNPFSQTFDVSGLEADDELSARLSRVASSSAPGYFDNIVITIVPEPSVFGPKTVDGQWPGVSQDFQCLSVASTVNCFHAPAFGDFRRQAFL